MIAPNPAAPTHARPSSGVAAGRAGRVGTLPAANDRDVAVYVRISEDREGAGLGVERQEQDARRLADQRGYRVVAAYTDNDLSAYLRRKPRHDYLRMMADFRAGRFGRVLVWHLDRLYRQPRELEDMIELCEGGERRVESCYGDYDLSTPDGCFMARIMVANANKESADKSRRLRRKMVELAEKGKPNGGGRTYGYTGDRQIVPAEAAVIREAVDRTLAGETLRSLCEDFYRRGITGARGAVLGRTALRNILQSGRISGQREHHGVIVGPGTWPAIITPEQTERLRAIFRDPARRSPGRGVSYLLSGFLRCGHCGARMVGRPRDGRRCYVCVRNVNSKVIGCGRMSRSAEPVEKLVTKALFAVFDSPAMARAAEGAHGDRGAVLMAQIAEDQAQLTELAGAYAAKRITMAEWLAARGPIERRIEEASTAFAAASRERTSSEYVGRGGALREDWGLLSIDRRRAVIAGVLDHIVDEPAERGSKLFDATKIKPVWKL
jgi:site-specific DNA recombinase